MVIGESNQYVVNRLGEAWENEENKRADHAPGRRDHTEDR